MSMELATVTGEEILQAVRAKHPLSLGLRLHPERAAVFQRYGKPEAVAALIRGGMNEVFFENRQMCMTERYMMEKDDPDSLLLFKDIHKAYPMKFGEKEYLMAEDEAGAKYRYSFAVGQKQVFKISILLDKIRKAAPHCHVKDRV